MTDALLRAIADRYGTPAYVYDLDAVAGNVARLRQALPAARLRFALKANANGAVLRLLAGLGVGAEVITEGELARALRAGIPPAEVLVGGPGQGAALVAEGARCSVGHVSLDSAGQWAAWRQALEGAHAGARQPRFLVRVNPGLDPHTHEHLATGAAGSKFGLPLREAVELAREVEGSGRLAGFHVHAGSMIRELAVFEQVTALLAPLYRQFPAADTLDLGGGFAVPDFPLTAFGAHATAVAGELGVALVLEPGRFLVASAGVLLSRVLHVKHGEPNHLVADAGMADLLRPALYGAEHPIRALGGARASRRSFDVDGPLCENADRLGRGRAMPELAPGALLVVEEAGAYGAGMASNYASSLRPAEVVVADGRARLSRRRERPEDLWRLEDEADADAEEDAAAPR